MTKSERKAYEGGARMAAYVVGRKGITEAAVRGSLADVRYVKESLREAYDRGYWDVLLGVQG